MSKRTKSPEYQIRKVSAKLAHLVDKFKASEGMPNKYRHHIHLEIIGKRRTLRHLSKLYIWGVK